MSTGLRGAAALLGLVLSGSLLSGCNAPWLTAGDEPEAPVIQVVNGGSEFELDAWSGCISGPSSGFCWDGTPPEEPVDVGVVAGEVEVVSGLAGWRWQAMARTPSSSPGTGSELTVEHSEDGRQLRLVVPSGGPYAVDLTGRGDEGDASYTFVASGER